MAKHSEAAAGLSGAPRAALSSHSHFLSLFLLAIPLLFSTICPDCSFAAVITKDTVWSGAVSLAEDVVVAPGATLTLAAGTVVKASPAESTKTDPEYLSPLTEITVRGALRVEGTPAGPVVLTGEKQGAGVQWAGIIVDGGTVTMTSAAISSADTGIYVISGRVTLTDVGLRENRYGVVAQGSKANLTGTRTLVAENDYGLVSLSGAKVETAGITIKRNRKKDTLDSAGKDAPSVTSPGPATSIPLTRKYGDEVLLGDTVWRGRVEVDGLLRVPEGSRLVIVPGTIVEFTRKDTNGDGIGENGILIQGRLLAKGSPESPIFFRSAAANRTMGDWDAINIMNSDETQNIIEYCRIEDAYRALHFHFSNVVVISSTLRNNYRGIQFQESLVEIAGSTICDNKSGVQGRDSEITFTDNLICANYIGANFFRANLTARKNRFIGNLREGIRLRERAATLEENLIDGNRFGLLVADSFYGSFSRNVITNNSETGAAMKNVDNIRFSGNFVAKNGLTGLSVQDARLAVSGNVFSDNAERGIGILSFTGIITENNFVKNGLYAIDVDGMGNVSAPANWWGGDKPEKVVFDAADDPSKGKLDPGTPAKVPWRYEWPLPEITTDILWRGDMLLVKPVAVNPGALLAIAPATTVALRGGVGLAVRGQLKALGERGGEIIFTSADKGVPWDEILLERAVGSAISHCIIENGTWGIHSHFTDLSVTGCRFRNNYGGMRFRSGPVKISGSRFEKNTIGIRAYIGNATISGNVITDNEIGIFVREKGGGVTISGNDISANTGYSLRVGDFNTEDIAAPGNWWGAGDPAEVIFDGRREPGIGMVRYEPYLTQSPKSAGEVTR